MAASLMAAGGVDLCIVGADRIAANGDVANKIGTLGVAMAARHFGIPFYVAAPTSTIDPATPSGAAVPIEQRAECEVTCGFGVPTAPDGVRVYNPAFDVTPAALVSAIVTDQGVYRGPYDFTAGQATTVAEPAAGSATATVTGPDARALAAQPAAPAAGAPPPTPRCAGPTPHPSPHPRPAVRSSAARPGPIAPRQLSPAHAACATSSPSIRAPPAAPASSSPTTDA
jgi:hypothetical protein